MTPVCTRCGNEFDEPGAIWIGIPDSLDLVSKTTKRHICPSCANIIEYLWDHNRKPFVDSNFWSNQASVVERQTPPV